MSKKGAMSRPIPMPVTSSDGRSCQGPTPDPAWSRVSQTPNTPSAMTTVPAWSTARPKRTNPCAIPKPTIMPPDQGTITRPALRGE